MNRNAQNSSEFFFSVFKLILCNDPCNGGQTTLNPTLHTISIQHLCPESLANVLNLESDIIIMNLLILKNIYTFVRILHETRKINYAFGALLRERCVPDILHIP